MFNSRRTDSCGPVVQWLAEMKTIALALIYLLATRLSAVQVSAMEQILAVVTMDGTIM